MFFPIFSYSSIHGPINLFADAELRQIHGCLVEKSAILDAVGIAGAVQNQGSIIFGDIIEDSVKILERGKSLLEKNFFDWAAVEFNKAMEINPELAIETVTKLFQEMQGGGNPDAIISLGINILKTDPENIELANLIGNAYRKKHDWKRAENMYQHCLKYDAENNYAVYNQHALKNIP